MENNSTVPSAAEKLPLSKVRFLKNMLFDKINLSHQLAAVRKGRFCNFLDEGILSNMIL